MQQTTMFLALALFGMLSVASAQMTFSDGWGTKRSVAASKPFGGEEEKGLIENPILEQCHTSYSQSLIDLHHKIMVLYENYQQCQSRAISVFQNKQRHQSNNN